jgi:serine/threonine protein kinase
MEQYKFDDDVVKPLKEKDMALEYDVLKELNSSVWADLFCAVEKESRNSCIIKQLKELNAEEAEQSLKKLNAIRSLLKDFPQEKRRPPLCWIFQVGYFHGKPAYAMESLERNLYEYVFDSSTFSSFTERIEIMCRIAEGIDMLHQIDILHLDLEPKNIMLRNFNEPVIIDLDSVPSRMMCELIEGNRPKKVFLNEPWCPSGISQITKGIDVFSLGCLIFFLFSDGEDLQQRFPFLLDQANQKIRPSQTPRPISRNTPWVGTDAQMAALDKLVLECSSAHERGIPSAKDVMTRLREIQKL